MIGPEDKMKLRRGMRTIWIFWVAMISSLVIYLVIAYLGNEELRIVRIPDPNYDLLLYSIMGLGAVLLFSTKYVRKFVLGQGSGVTSSNFTSSVRLSNTKVALGAYMRAVLISLAMCESVGIFGFVFFFLSGDFQILYLFLACAAVAMCINRPKLDELEGLAEAMN